MGVGAGGEPRRARAPPGRASPRPPPGPSAPSRGVRGPARALSALCFSPLTVYLFIFNNKAGPAAASPLPCGSAGGSRRPAWLGEERQSPGEAAWEETGLRGRSPAPLGAALTAGAAALRLGAGFARSVRCAWYAPLLLLAVNPLETCRSSFLLKFVHGNNPYF